MDEETMDQKELLQRIEELLSVLNMISRDLKDITRVLRDTSVPSTVGLPVGTRTIESVEALFPKNLQVILAFEDVGDDVLIKPKQYLGSDNFTKILSIVRDNGGEYVSAGKDSHFRLPK